MHNNIDGWIFCSSLNSSGTEFNSKIALGKVVLLLEGQGEDNEGNQDNNNNNKDGLPAGSGGGGIARSAVTSEVRVEGDGGVTGGSFLKDGIVIGHNSWTQNNPVVVSAGLRIPDLGSVLDEDVIDAISDLSGVSLRRDGEVLTIAQTDNDVAELSDITLVDVGVLRVLIGGLVSDDFLFLCCGGGSGGRVVKFGQIGDNIIHNVVVGETKTREINIEDDVGICRIWSISSGEWFPIDSGTKGDILSRHGPIGVSGEGNRALGRINQTGVLSEDKFSSSSSGDVNREERMITSKVLGGISINSHTDETVGAIVLEIISTQTLTRVLEGVMFSIEVAVKQSVVLEFPAGCVISDGDADTEGVTLLDPIIGMEAWGSLVLGGISLAVISIALEFDKFRTISAETSGTVRQEEEHVSGGLGSVNTSFCDVFTSEININSGEVGVVDGSETF